jgi:hypothetical protein
LKILGAVLQADAETRSVVTASTRVILETGTVLKRTVQVLS